VGPTVGLFGFLAQVNTVSAEKLHACMHGVRYILTFGYWGLQAAISNTWPLKVKFPEFLDSPTYVGDGRLERDK